MPCLNYAIIALFLFTISYSYAAETNFHTNITSKNRLRIAVPAHSFSENFVKFNGAENAPSGFCIDVFNESVKLLNYSIYNDYDFFEFDGSYDDLVSSVANETFDAAVGDITIMSQRWLLVDFTEPFTESGLSMVVPKKPAQEWIFLKPFTVKLWLASGGILVYTMFVIWFIEHRSNEDFNGPTKYQFGNALWFTFCSLFFAQRERINRSHTRVVVVVWLFVVLILVQSYNASFTSMLTVTSLNPNIDCLKRENATVGCDENSFMKNFVEHQLGYNNTIAMVNDTDYLKSFDNGDITAAFMEIPYAKFFVNKYCKDFTETGSSYRFGGLSFAFQKGSGIAYNISEAILILSENGMLKSLEEKWLTPSTECTDSNATDDVNSLRFESFWGLFLFSIAVSTLSCLLYIIRLLKNYPQYKREHRNDSSENYWRKFVGLVTYLKNEDLIDQRLAPSSSKVVPEIEMLEEFNHVIVNTV